MSERTIWRLLEHGEVIKDGDEFWDMGRWNPSKEIGWAFSETRHLIHRRRETLPTVQYPAPRYDDPAKCADPERMILEWSHGAQGGSYWGTPARRWTPGRAWLEQPPAPVPQKSEAEIAWEANERASCGGVSGMDKHSFIQGFECHTLTAKGKP